MKRLLVIAVALSIIGAEALATELVRVDGGLVSGTDSARPGVRVYKGIPFAAPPVLDRRWRAPQPVEPWKDALVADRYAPMCLQLLRFKDSVFYQGEEPSSEDCLYLNVWTPAKTASERLPVMVFIFGGGFVIGSGSLPIYAGDGLAAKGAVVVTFNYRVGVLGFLAHPELTKESGHNASGNYALMDQIAALAWVKRNIAAFGGDPGRVTIYGQSAGASTIADLQASPLARGLFHRVIGESGGAFGGMMGPDASLADAEQQGVKFAEERGARSIAELRAIPGDRFLAVGGGFRHIIDGYALPEAPAEVFAAGRQIDVPVIVGSNANEGTPYPGAASAAKFIEDAHARFGDKADRFLELYPARSDAEALASSYAALRDGTFAWQVWTWARLQSKSGKAPVYLYHFGHAPPYREGLGFREQNPASKLGAYHGAEMLYAFNSLDLMNRNGPVRNYTDVDRRLADTLSSYWVSFAATGNPNAEGLPTWPTFNAQRAELLRIGDTAEPGPVPHLAELEFFDGVFARSAKR